MSSINAFLGIAGANVLETSAIDEHGVGTLAIDSQGRLCRWAKAGAAAITRGKLQLAPARKTNHDNNECNTASIGDTTVTVTLGGTAAVANEYSMGSLVVVDDTGEGIAYQIDSHPAADANATLVVTLREPIKVAFGANTTVSLMHNTWNGVVEGTSSTAQPAGIAANNVAIAQFGWLITNGIAPALADETLTVGAQLTAGTSVAGAVEESDDDTTPLTDNYVGWAVVAGVDTEYRPIQVSID